MQMVIHLNASHNKTFFLVTVNVTGISSRTVEGLILWWGLTITDFVYVRCRYKFKAFAITMSVNVTNLYVCLRSDPRQNFIPLASMVHYSSPSN